MFKHVSISDMSPPVMTMPDLSAMFDTRKDALSKFSVATMARAAIVQWQDGTYPCEMVCDNQHLTGQITCSFPAALNPHFDANENFGFAWLQTMGILPSNDHIDALMASAKTDPKKAAAVEKIDRFKKTNITLLSALTLPTVSEPGLQFGAKVNGFLFTVDNEFDKVDSVFSGNIDLTQHVFEAFEAAFQTGRPVPTPADLPPESQAKFTSFIRAMADIGAHANQFGEAFKRNIFEGLTQYKMGNMAESRVRRPRSDSGSHGDSIFRFMQKRANAGAVDFVFEVAFALLELSVPTISPAQQSAWVDLKHLYKLHICIFNDIKSRNKEKAAGLMENLMILFEEEFKKANSPVCESLNSVTRELDRILEAINTEKTYFLTHIPALAPLMKAMEDWTVGHIIWELVSFDGRHTALPVVDPVLCEDIVSMRV